MDTNTQVTLSEARGPLDQLNENLSGKNGREWLNAFKRFLRKEHPWVNTKWKIWTIARMGTKKPLADLVTTIKSRGYTIRYSDFIPLDLLSLEKTLKFNEIEEDVYFALISPKDLGLKPGWTKRKFLDALPKNGLSPLLSGDILEILAQGHERLIKGVRSLDVGMEPILIGHCHANFCIADYDDDGYYFGYHNGDLTQIWNFPDNVNNKHIVRIAYTI